MDEIPTPLITSVQLFQSFGSLENNSASDHDDSPGFRHVCSEARCLEISCLLPAARATFFLLKIFLVIYFISEKERKRKTDCEGGRARERETQNPKQAPGSKLGLKPTNHKIMT